MRSSIRDLAILSFATLSSLAPACATTPAPPEPGMGELAIPLETIDGRGTLYHMSAKFIVVSGSSLDTPGGMQTVDGTGAGCVVTASVLATTASVGPADGWTLRASMDHGVTYAPVSAVVGERWISTHILANQVNTWIYQLLVDTPDGQEAIFFSKPACAAAALRYGAAASDLPSAPR